MGSDERYSPDLDGVVKVWGGTETTPEVYLGSRDSVGTVWTGTGVSGNLRRISRGEGGEPRRASWD